MPDTKLDPATLNATVREVARGIKVSFDRNGEISQTHLLDWIMAMTALFGTATEKVKESKFPVGHCQVCGELVAPYNKHAKYEGGYTCQPSHPEPAATEMPQPLRDAARFLRDIRRDFQEGNKRFTDSLCEQHAAEIESCWRNLAQGEQAVHRLAVRAARSRDRILLAQPRAAGGGRDDGGAGACPLGR